MYCPLVLTSKLYRSKCSIEVIHSHLTAALLRQGGEMTVGNFPPCRLAERFRNPLFNFFRYLFMVAYALVKHHTGWRGSFMVLAMSVQCCHFGNQLLNGIHHPGVTLPPTALVAVIKIVHVPILWVAVNHIREMAKVVPRVIINFSW